LLSRKQTIAGEIKLAFNILSPNVSENAVSGSRFSSSMSKGSIPSQRKVVLSAEGSTYFQPFVSHPIPTTPTLIDLEADLSTPNTQQKSSFCPNCSARQRSKGDEPFRAGIT
jgi:hypothetical protein